MGVKHSKQSVDISSTPKKPGAPVEEINGKTVEKTEVEEITKLNGEVEKSNAVNGDAPTTNGDVKVEDKEAASGDAPAAEDKNDLEETKQNRTDVAESYKDEEKKMSMKYKVKKSFL